tara:strand:- start:172 stop:867 length:696 start_codon:yes stop_codon:yes gene_type:complete
MKASHGFLKEYVNSVLLRDVLLKVDKYLSSQDKVSNYYPDISTFIPEVKLLINSNVEELVSDLLSTSDPQLCAIELHVQLPGCKPIPPHQDNFYHCIVPPEYGLKILIPLKNLDSLSGGLLFLDTPINYPVIKHIPSTIPNFSSIISSVIFNEISNEILSYEYEVGDISYHYLNSIHLSYGNKTNISKPFLVFRFQHPEATQDKDSIDNYITCTNAHKHLMRSININKFEK